MRPTGLLRAKRDLVELDRAVHAAVQATPTPSLDLAFARLSQAADHSGIWLAVAAGLAASGERRRRAGLVGIVSVVATSALVNVVVKPVVRRERPERLTTVRTHVVRMPTSASYPSGHAASAFAFSTAVGGALPEVDTVLRLAATAVGYSRVHTGVHHPGDVVAGAILGAGVGSLTRHLAERVPLVPGRARGASWSSARGVRRA